MFYSVGSVPNVGGFMKFRLRQVLGVSIFLLFFPTLGKAVEGYRLVCDEPVYRFGTVDQSAVITNVFTIRNEGDLSFMLKYVHTSCGCTRGRMDKRVIDPGESVELTAVYKAIRRKGTQKKSIKIIPIHSDKPALTLYMEGFVEIPSARLPVDDFLSHFNLRNMRVEVLYEAF